MWNYRVVRKKNIYIDPTDKKERVDCTYAIHEAFYDKNGYVGAITQDPVEPFGEREPLGRGKEGLGGEMGSF